MVLATRALLVMPMQRRRCWWGKLNGRLSILHSWVSDLLRFVVPTAAALPSITRMHSKSGGATLRRYKRPLAVVLFSPAAPAPCIQLCRRPRILAGYEALPLAQDPVVLALPQGEPLAPPPPLPP